MPEYNYDHAKATNKDRARSLLGDTGVDGGVWLLSDEEIQADLNTLPFNQAVANLAMGLATRFAQFPDEVETPGGGIMRYRERVEAWQKLANEMKAAPNPGASAPRRTVALIGNLANPAVNKIR